MSAPSNEQIPAGEEPNNDPGPWGSVMEAAALRRLLLPIKTASEALDGARYAKSLEEQGIAVKVCLLHVAGADHNSEHMIARSPQQARKAEEEQARALLQEATMHLKADDVAHGVLIEWGDVVFSILDVAELLDCHEIVLPAAKTRGWLSIFSNGITEQLLRHQRGVPVVIADRPRSRVPK